MIRFWKKCIGKIRYYVKSNFLFVLNEIIYYFIFLLVKKDFLLWYILCDCKLSIFGVYNIINLLNKFYY